MSIPSEDPRSAVEMLPGVRFIRVSEPNEAATFDPDCVRELTGEQPCDVRLLPAELSSQHMKLCRQIDQFLSAHFDAHVATIDIEDQQGRPVFCWLNFRSRADAANRNLDPAVIRPLPDYPHHHEGDLDGLIGIEEYTVRVTLSPPVNHHPLSAAVHDGKTSSVECDDSHNESSASTRTPRGPDDTAEGEG
jgi:hypothetical protein